MRMAPGAPTRHDLQGVTRRRLDLELVRRGLASSRNHAGQLVATGRVLVSGSVAAKSASLVAPGDAVTVVAPPATFVSRGGDKLAHALDARSVAVDGRACLDVGASTGGFTDCLLQHGASSVVSVDSGHGQIHPRLRGDPRVTVLERTNARHLGEQHPDLLGQFELVVADVSFISLRVLAPVLVACAAGDHADVVVLVKPQFEAGRSDVARGRGVVRDRAVRKRAVIGVVEALTGAGAWPVGVVASPLLGPAGNAEIFVHARGGRLAAQATGHRATSPGGDLLGLDAAIEAALDDLPDAEPARSAPDAEPVGAAPDDLTDANPIAAAPRGGSTAADWRGEERTGAEPGHRR